MLVLTDRRTGSSGESVAWMLREGLGARIAGRPTAGVVRFGMAAPYLLPRSGLTLILPTKINYNPRDVELAGNPVDVDLNPVMPLEDVANDFDRIWSRVGEADR
jgi:C-terminal processing protease CtpA/Prc